MRLLGSVPGSRQPKHLAPKKSRTAVGISPILIAAGIVMLLAGGIIAGYGFIDDYSAGQNARTLLKQIRGEVYPAVTGEPVKADPSPLDPSPKGSNTPSAAPELQFDAVGILTIPKLALELPVLSEYSDSLLKVSVCRYEGKVLDKPERLVVAGHNYRSHFGKLRKLAVGDEVRFSNIDGSEYSYTVTEITIISMHDHRALEDGEWHITLFTCDSDRSKRILIRCRENPSLN